LDLVNGKILLRCSCAQAQAAAYFEILHHADAHSGAHADGHPRRDVNRCSIAQCGVADSSGIDGHVVV
jgi:hypothetical protein